MQDIVRILQDIAEGRGLEYHYGKKAALNILDGTLNVDKVYMLHEYTNRKSEYNQTGTGITAVTYEGKFFLVKHSNLDAPIFNENGNEPISKYTLNIEPLLTLFGEIGNQLACDSIAVTQWDCVDITDALDANFDGLLIIYRMRIESTYIPATGGGGNPGGGSSLPVITNSDTGNYFTVGTELNLQITVNANGHTVSGYNASNLPEYLGIDTATGLITGTLPDTEDNVTFGLQVLYDGGQITKGYNLQVVAYDVNTLSPPYNPEVTSYNTVGVSFIYEYDVQHYAPGYERLEFFIDGELYRTFIDGMPFDINQAGHKADLMQRVPPLPVLTPFEFKCRFKSQSGAYSAFSEALMITIPQP